MGCVSSSPSNTEDTRTTSQDFRTSDPESKLQNEKVRGDKPSTIAGNSAIALKVTAGVCNSPKSQSTPKASPFPGAGTNPGASHDDDGMRINTNSGSRQYTSHQQNTALSPAPTTLSPSGCDLPPLSVTDSASAMPHQHLYGSPSAPSLSQSSSLAASAVEGCKTNIVVDKSHALFPNDLVFHQHTLEARRSVSAVEALHLEPTLQPTSEDSRLRPIDSTICADDAATQRVERVAALERLSATDGSREAQSAAIVKLAEDVLTSSGKSVDLTCLTEVNKSLDGHSVEEVAKLFRQLQRLLNTSGDTTWRQTLRIFLLP